LDPGARIEVRRGAEPVLLARLRAAGTGAAGTGAAEGDVGAPFTDRLVAKFGLPVTGWRGRGARRPADGGHETAHDELAPLRAAGRGEPGCDA